MRIKKVYSNYSYLPDGRVLSPESLALCEAGPARAESVFLPLGEWLEAAQMFHLRGGRGVDFDDPGLYIKAGQKFRLQRAGTPWIPAVWEVEA